MFDLEISTFKNRKCFSFVLFSKIGIYMLFLNWSSSTVPFISSFQSSHRPFSPIPFELSNRRVVANSNRDLYDAAASPSKYAWPTHRLRERLDSIHDALKGSNERNK